MDLFRCLLVSVLFAMMDFWSCWFTIWYDMTENPIGFHVLFASLILSIVPIVNDVFTCIFRIEKEGPCVGMLFSGVEDLEYTTRGLCAVTKSLASHKHAKAEEAYQLYKSPTVSDMSYDIVIPLVHASTAASSYVQDEVAKPVKCSMMPYWKDIVMVLQFFIIVYLCCKVHM